MAQIDQSRPTITALDARLRLGEKRLFFVDSVADQPVLPVPAMAPLPEDIVSVVREIQVWIDCILDARRPSPLQSGARSAIWRLEENAAWKTTIDRLARIPSPVLRSIQSRLTETTLRHDALDLVATHLPDQLSRYQPGDSWFSILLDFLKRVEQADWVPLDEALLMDLERATASGSAGRRELTEMLEFIPLRMVGPDYELIYEAYDYAANWPPGLLYGLFVDACYLTDSCVFLREGFDPGEIDPDKIALGVQHAPPGTFDPDTPLIYLPEVVSLYRHETGFCLIDEPGDCGYSPTDIFSWADLDRLRVEWGAVKPMLERCAKLEQWLRSGDNTRRFIELVLTLSKGGED